MTAPAAFDAETADQIDGILDLINEGFSDAFAFVSRWYEADDDISDATLLSIDPRGADAEVTGPTGTRPVRFDFAEPIADLGGLEHALLGLLHQARAARPDDPLTKIEASLANNELQGTYRCMIQRAVDLNGQLRAFTLGPVTGWDHKGGDQSMTLFLDLPGRPIPEVIRLSELQGMGADVRPKGATYSVRRYDPAAATIEVWVALHGDDPHTIGGWAATASVGDPITVWGPRRAGETPTDVSRFVGVCDETGVAATLATLDELPAEVPAEIVMEIADEAAEFALTERPGVTVHWCHRGGAEPGTGTALLDRARELITERVDDIQVFGAGESRTMTSVRKYLRRELEIPASQVTLVGYWRRT
ncbi:MAG: SIP domain-containing protein [Actinomycetota bacterium]